MTQQLRPLASTRSAARAIGATRYFTGKPCSKGHVAERHLTGTCVECAKVAVAAWALRNPDEGNRRSAAWRRRNPERAREVAIRSKRKTMGIPEATRPRPMHCELCGRLPKTWHLDHCHVTGNFRGWLCNRCNMALGHLGDNIVGLQKAIEYLLMARSV
jgi:hypothetical protein